MKYIVELQEMRRFSVVVEANDVFSAAEIAQKLNTKNGYSIQFLESRLESDPPIVDWN